MTNTSGQSSQPGTPGCTPSRSSNSRHPRSSWPGWDMILVGRRGRLEGGDTLKANPLIAFCLALAFALGIAGSITLAQSGGRAPTGQAAIWPNGASEGALLADIWPNDRANDR